MVTKRKKEPEQAAEQPPVATGWGLDGQEVPVNQPEEQPTPPAPEEQPSWGGEPPVEQEEDAKVAASRAPRPKKTKVEKESEKAVQLSNMRTDLVSGVERIERLAEEAQVIREDIKEIYSELKSRGYSAPIIRKLIARRAMDADKRKEMDALLDLYEEAVQ